MTSPSKSGGLSPDLPAPGPKTTSPVISVDLQTCNADVAEELLAALEEVMAEPPGGTGQV